MQEKQKVSCMVVGRSGTLAIARCAPLSMGEKVVGCGGRWNKNVSYDNRVVAQC